MLSSRGLPDKGTYVSDHTQTSFHVELSESFSSTCCNLKRVKILPGSSHPELGVELASSLDVPLLKCTISRFKNGEIRVELRENVRGYDVFIIQTGISNEKGSINDYLVETLILIDACRRSNARKVTLICPNFPYARQDKKDGPRQPISSKMVANVLSACGIDRLITFDLHAAQLQGFFDIPVDNLYCIDIFINHLKEKYFTGLTQKELQDKFIFVSPDNGGAKRVFAYSDKTGINNLIMHKQRDYTKPGVINKSILVGESALDGKTAIIVDDICDSGGTLMKACDILIEHNVKEIMIIVTHGIFSDPAVERIDNKERVTKVITTNTISPVKILTKPDKIDIVDIVPTLSDVIRIICTKGGSISEIFS